MRIKRNGNSIQMFEEGIQGEEYVGSISIKELCYIIKEKRANGTTPPLAQTVSEEEASKLIEKGELAQNIQL